MQYLSAVCVLAGLIAGLGCGRLTKKGVFVDSSFEPFIPPDTKVLAGVRVAKLKTAPLYIDHKKQLDFSQLQAFSERTGIDPTRDVSEILITWNGKQAMAIVRGHFSQSTIGPKLDSLGAHRRTYKKHTLFGDDKNSLVFVKDGLILAGSPQALRDAIDAQGSSDAGIPEELKQRLETIPKDDQIWAVSRGGLPLIGIPLRSDVDSALSNIVGYISGTAMGVGIDTGVHVLADLSCISDQGAQRVRDALRGGLGLARLTTKDNQLELLRLYDSIHVDQENSAIHVRADLAPDLANTLLSYIPQMRNGAGQMLRRVP